jgi:hypothetical protein
MHNDDSDVPVGPDSDPGEKRRVRLRPRTGSEHRYRFARRWESRRRSRAGIKLWRLIMLDIGAIVLLYLLGRQLIRKIAG